MLFFRGDEISTSDIEITERLLNTKYVENVNRLMSSSSVLKLYKPFHDIQVTHRKYHNNYLTGTRI